MRPNVVMILMDDLGWKDLGCTGSTFYETPNLDKLAKQGMRFTDAYASCPVCSPSRASIMTGKYPARVGVTNFIDWSGKHHPLRGRLIDAPYLKQLPQSEISLARALKSAGYRTCHVGKWHLGGEGHFPQDHGFDVNVGGGRYGAPIHGYWSPYKLDNLPEGPEGEYLPDRLTREAVDLIRAEDDRPFFLNLWHYLVHTPIQAKPDAIAYFKAKAERLGLDKEMTFEEGDFFPTDITRKRRIRRRLLQSDPVYAAMVKHMDDSVGAVMQALEETGKAANTAVFFTSDNGGLATSEGSPTCNLPLIEGKGWMYEGGTRVPLLVRWPEKIQAESVCRVPVTSPDFYPTILEMAGAKPDPNQKVDGVSILPLLTQEGTIKRDAIFWHYPHYGNQGGRPGASVRAGDWKLIEFFEDNHVELYNLREDQGEDRDLAAAQPERTRELLEMLHAWQGSVAAVRPEHNPDWKD
ncbi:MAG: sulfatase [Planctomycetota bacterium]|nr:sulfatase [Planctomycetota bacterium]